MKRAIHALRNFVRRLRDDCGAATVEFALVTGTLVSLMLNGIEIGRYYFIRMEVQNATQMAVQAVWKICDTASENPVTVRCSGRTSAITRGLQSTTLGNNVTLATGYPTEAYYCTSTSTGALQNVGAVTSARPADCTAAGSSTDIPGNYLIVRGEYTYAPLFRGITIGTSLPTNIQATSTMRMR
jgi:Flp pilus assembly protein TadG